MMKIPHNPIQPDPQLPGLPPNFPPDFPPLPPEFDPFTAGLTLPESQNALSALVNISEFETQAREGVLDLYKQSLKDNSPQEIAQEYEAVKSARQQLEFMARTPEMDKVYQALVEMEGVLYDLNFNQNPILPDILPDFPPMPDVDPNFPFLADNE